MKDHSEKKTNSLSIPNRVDIIIKNAVSCNLKLVSLTIKSLW